MTPRRGFTLIEMLVALAIGVVLLALAAPSFREYILMQRLKGVNAQVVTDMAYARSEAVARGVPVHVRVMAYTPAAQMSCYVIYTYDAALVTPAQGTRRCDCTRPPATRCGANTTELRTVQAPGELKVFVQPNNQFNSTHLFFDPRNGGMTATSVDGVPLALNPYDIETYVDAARKFRDQIGVSGRTSVCIPPGSTLSGDAC